MSFYKFFGVPVRWIRRSSVASKMPALGSLSKKDKLNLDDTVKVPVETDPQKLVEYVCGTNLLMEGGENIKVKEDKEYPDWLWSIRSPVPLEELDPNTKTYWNKIRKIRQKEEQYLKSLKRNSTIHK